MTGREKYRDIFNRCDPNSNGLTEQELRREEDGLFNYRCKPDLRGKLITEGVITFVNGKYYYNGDSRIKSPAPTSPILSTPASVTPPAIVPSSHTITLYEFTKDFLINQMLSGTTLLDIPGLPSSYTAIETWLDINYLRDNNLTYAHSVDPLANEDNEIFRELCSAICTQQAMPSFCDRTTYFAIKNAFCGFDIPYVANRANRSTITTALRPIITNINKLNKFLDATFENATILNSIINRTTLMNFFRTFSTTAGIPFEKYQEKMPNGSPYKFYLMRVPIACHFMKEIGLSTLAKPDTLLKEFSANIGYTHSRIYPFGTNEEWAVFDLVNNNAIGCSTYALDKLIWLCMSEHTKFYKHNNANFPKHDARRIKRDFLTNANRLYAKGTLSII